MELKKKYVLVVQKAKNKDYVQFGSSGLDRDKTSTNSDSSSVGLNIWEAWMMLHFVPVHISQDKWKLMRSRPEDSHKLTVRHIFNL